MDDVAQRRDLQGHIAMRLVNLNIDELRVLDNVLEGLEQGRSVYGPLDIEGDDRDWHREARDEIRDALVYTAVRMLRDAE